MSDHLGVDLSRTTNAEESVARGCALQVNKFFQKKNSKISKFNSKFHFFSKPNHQHTHQCAILSPVFKVREFAVTDITPAPVRLVWKGDDQSEDNVTDVFTGAFVFCFRIVFLIVSLLYCLISLKW